MTGKEADPEVELLMIGGGRHGQVVKLRAGTQSFTDLATSTTYYVRPFVWAPVSPITRQPDKENAVVRFVLVHESVQDPQSAWAILDDYLRGRWVREDGRSLREVAAEEAAAMAALNGTTPDAPAPGIILNGKATP